MAASWLLFAAWAIPTFLVLERSARGLVCACALLAVNVAVTYAIAFGPRTGTHVVAAFALAELFAYVAHRAQHAIPLLWRFHRLHHVDEPLAFHRAWHVHPIDTALLVAATSLACVIAGAPLPAAGWFVMLRRAWALLLHARVRWPATAADAVVATPSFHRRHHREDLRPANFAFTFAFVDRVFGTWAR